jgi:hypothetical protein
LDHYHFREQQLSAQRDQELLNDEPKDEPNGEPRGEPNDELNDERETANRNDERETAKPKRRVINDISFRRGSDSPFGFAVQCASFSSLFSSPLGSPFGSSFVFGSWFAIRFAVCFQTLESIDDSCVPVTHCHSGLATFSFQGFPRGRDRETLIPGP